VTITAVDEGEDYVFGYTLYDSDIFVASSPTHLNVAGDIYNNDLSTLSPYTIPGGSLGWAITWCFYLRATELYANTSRFISALPKYDIGQYEVAFRGNCTHSGYINFLAQRSPNFTCWDLDANIDYPSQYLPPTPVSGASLFSLIEFGFTVNTYGTDLYLQCGGINLESLQVYVYYRAESIAQPNPSSYGDI
jgi:hypothetical protein